MAAAARAPFCSRCSSSFSSSLSFFSKRLFSSPFSLHLGLRSPPFQARTFHPSHAAQVIAPHRLNPVRCVVRRSGGDSAYLPLKSGSNFSDRPPTEMAPLFPGCDYEHWLIVMGKPGGEGTTKQQVITCYVQTLAKVVGRNLEKYPSKVNLQNKPSNSTNPLNRFLQGCLIVKDKVMKEKKPHYTLPQELALLWEKVRQQNIAKEENSKS